MAASPTGATSYARALINAAIAALMTATTAAKVLMDGALCSKGGDRTHEDLGIDAVLRVQTVAL
jgi:hypothetical protein